MYINKIVELAEEEINQYLTDRSGSVEKIELFSDYYDPFESVYSKIQIVIESNEFRKKDLFEIFTTYNVLINVEDYVRSHNLRISKANVARGIKDLMESVKV